MIRREADLTDRTSSQFSGDRRMYEHIDSLQSPLPRLEAVGSTDQQPLYSEELAAMIGGTTTSQQQNFAKQLTSLNRDSKNKAMVMNSSSSNYPQSNEDQYLNDQEAQYQPGYQIDVNLEEQMMMQQRCYRLQSLLEHYQIENVNLKGQLNGMVEELNQAIDQKQSLNKAATQKVMLELQSKIVNLEQELLIAHRAQLNEKDHTIQELQEHIKLLEQQMYLKDLDTQKKQKSPMSGFRTSGKQDSLQTILVQSNGNLSMKQQALLQQHNSMRYSSQKVTTQGTLPRELDEDESNMLLNQQHSESQLCGEGSIEGKPILYPSGDLPLQAQQTQGETVQNRYCISQNSRANVITMNQLKFGHEDNTFNLQFAESNDQVDRIQLLENELKDTHSYYQAKLYQLERQFKLLGSVSNIHQNEMTGKFGFQQHTTMNYGEKQLLLEQIALIEEERDQFKRKMQVIQLENQILSQAFRQRDQTGQISQFPVKQLLPVIHSCINDDCIRGIMQISSKIDNARNKYNNYRDFVHALELVIIEIESSLEQMKKVSNKIGIDTDRVRRNVSEIEDLYGNITEMALTLSQIAQKSKNDGEKEMVIDKIKSALTQKLEEFITHHFTNLNGKQDQDSEKQKNDVQYPSKSSNCLSEIIDQKCIVNNIESEEDDEYWSDFSDEDFMIEEQEEKTLLQTFYQLQSWLNSFLQQNKDVDIMKIMKNFEPQGMPGYIRYNDLHQVFVQIGFKGCNFIDLAALISYLEQSGQTTGMLDYRILIRDLKQKPYPWWQERLQNNCFELRNAFNKEGSFTKLLTKKDFRLKEFQFSVIAEKILKCSDSKTNNEPFTRALVVTQKWFERRPSQEFLTKSQFRKLLLSDREAFPLTRLECHLLVKSLISENDKVEKSNLLQYFAKPLDFRALLNPLTQNKKPLTLSYLQGQHDIKEEYSDLMKVISSFISESNKENGTRDKGLQIVENWFQTFDNLRDGTVDLSSFHRVIKSLEIPLSRFEVYTVFKKLVQLESSHSILPQPMTSTSRIHYQTFIRELKQSEISCGRDLPMAIGRDKQKKSAQMDDKENSQLLENLNLTDYDKIRSLIINDQKTIRNEPKKSLNECRSALQIMSVKHRIEQLVQKHSKKLQQSGLDHMSNTLSRASQLKIREIREEYELEKDELNKKLALKNKEVEGFSRELEGLMFELEKMAEGANRGNNK